MDLQVTADILSGSTGKQFVVASRTVVAKITVSQLHALGYCVSVPRRSVRWARQP